MPPGKQQRPHRYRKTQHFYTNQNEGRLPLLNRTACRNKQNYATATYLSWCVLCRAQNRTEGACFPRDLAPTPFFSCPPKIPLFTSIAPLCRLPPDCRRGAEGVPGRQVGARRSPLRPLLPVGRGKTNRARLSARSHLGCQNRYPTSVRSLARCARRQYTHRAEVCLFHVCAEMGARR